MTLSAEAFSSARSDRPAHVEPALDAQWCDRSCDPAARGPVLVAHEHRGICGVVGDQPVQREGLSRRVSSRRSAAATDRPYRAFDARRAPGARTRPRTDSRQRLEVEVDAVGVGFGHGLDDLAARACARASGSASSASSSACLPCPREALHRQDHAYVRGLGALLGLAAKASLVQPAQPGVGSPSASSRMQPTVATGLERRTRPAWSARRSRCDAAGTAPSRAGSRRPPARRARCGASSTTALPRARRAGSMGSPGAAGSRASAGRARGHGRDAERQR